METARAVQEGSIPFAGYRTWYRMVGSDATPGRLPVLLLHGGPGVPHGCLEPLEALAGAGRRVIFYDQLGCGNSAIPTNPSLWTIDLFVREVAAVREALGLERVHVLGHSWGGMLAMEYALTQPAGLVSLVLSDTHASTPQFQAELERLNQELPPEVRETMRRHEATGTTDDPEYQQAAQVFPQRHVFAGDVPPDYLARALQQSAERPQVAQTMYGQLEHWDITHCLGEIAVPALVVTGRHGLATPALSETIHAGISGSRLEIFENSAHFPYISETDRYLEVVEQFLREVER